MSHKCDKVLGTVPLSFVSHTWYLSRKLEINTFFARDLTSINGRLVGRPSLPVFVSDTPKMARRRRLGAHDRLNGHTVVTKTDRRLTLEYQCLLSLARASIWCKSSAVYACTVMVVEDQVKKMKNRFFRSRSLV